MSNSVKSGSISWRCRFALLVTITLWASAYVGIRIGLDSYSPAGLALFRYLVASLVMSIICYVMISLKRIRSTPIPLKHRAWMLFAGALGIGVYNLGLNYGEISVPSGIASFITSQTPILTALFAFFFMGEQFNLLRLFGFILAVCGAVLMLMSMSSADAFEWDASVAWIFIATISSSFYSILQKPLLKFYSPIVFTTHAIFGGTLFLLLTGAPIFDEIHHASSYATSTVIYLGIFPAALGYLAWSFALSEIPITQAVSFLYLLPFVATFIGWLVLDEVPTMLSMVGGVLSILSVMVVNYSYRRTIDRLKN